MATPVNKLRGLQNGFAEIETSGGAYSIPEDVARYTYPELFGTPAEEYSQVDYSFPEEPSPVFNEPVTEESSISEIDPYTDVQALVEQRRAQIPVDTSAADKVASSASVDYSGPVQSKKTGLYDTVEYAQRIGDLEAEQAAGIAAQKGKAAELEYREGIERAVAEQRAQQTLAEHAKILDEEYLPRFQAVVDEYERKRSQFENYIQTIPSVDPNRVWTEGSQLGNAMAILGVAFGAAGSQARGGYNTAKIAVEKIIDRDIAAQEANINTQLKKAQFGKELLDIDMDFLHDKQTWLLKEKAGRYASLVGQLEAQRTLYKSVYKQAEVAQAKIAAEEKFNENASKALQNIQKAAENQNTLLASQQADQARVRLGYSQLAETKRANKAKEEQEKLNLPLMKYQQGRAVSPQTGLYTLGRNGEKQPWSTITEEQQKEIYTRANSVNRTHSALERILKLLELDPSAISGKDRAEFESELSMAIQNKGEALGRLTQPDVVMIQKGFTGGDPTKLDFWMQIAKRQDKDVFMNIVKRRMNVEREDLTKEASGYNEIIDQPVYYEPEPLSEKTKSLYQKYKPLSMPASTKEVLDQGSAIRERERTGFAPNGILNNHVQEVISSASVGFFNSKENKAELKRVRDSFTTQTIGGRTREATSIPRVLVVTDNDGNLLGEPLPEINFDPEGKSVSELSNAAGLPYWKKLKEIPITEVYDKVIRGEYVKRKNPGNKKPENIAPFPEVPYIPGETLSED